MKGNWVQIPFLGINNELLTDQSRDGLCETIVNLKPKGNEQKPYWVPFEEIQNLRNSESDPFTYQYQISSITAAFWQVRNFVGEYVQSESTSLRRLIVLCQNSERKAIDVIDPIDWGIVSTLELPLDGQYRAIFTRVNEITAIAIIRNEKPWKLYYLIDDIFIQQGWPELPEITYRTIVQSFTEEQILAGQTQGIQRDEEATKYFMVRWAFKLYDGTYVKHSQFQLVEVAPGSPQQYVTIEFTHEGYEEELLENEPFWESLIAGVSVFCTLSSKTRQQALDDGVWYETGFWPWIDKLDESKWPTEADPNIIKVELPEISWATQRNLNIDNLTHHRFSANVVDTYNSRLLLGGSSVDFTVIRPKIKPQTETIDRGPYTEFLDFVSGFFNQNTRYFTNDGTEVSGNDEFDYTTDTITYNGLFSPKSGREFKSVTIIDQEDGAEDINPPGGPTPVPTAQYTASIDGNGNVLFEIIVTSTSFGTGGDVDVRMTIELEIGNIGEPADDTLTFDVLRGGSPPPHVAFSNFTTQGIAEGDFELGNMVFHKFTIRTDSGTYYRIYQKPVSDTLEQVFLDSNTIWYPDRRATQYQMIVRNEGVYELAIDKKLIAHPSNNYAYVMLTSGETVYTLGSSEIEADAVDLSLNEVQQWVRNRGQISLTEQPFVIEIASSFRVGDRERDTIMAFGVNVDKTTEGQFGQYPLYVFSDKGVWALEQIGDPNIAFGRLSPVTNFNGLSSYYSVANAQKLLIAADSKYIYALSGYEAQRIDDAISNDPNYEQFLANLIIGYHRARDYEEVIFCNPFFDYCLYYNLRYGFWYKGDRIFRHFFYEYPELMGITIDNEIKDFGHKDVNANVSWSLKTRRMFLGQPYQLKKLFQSFIRSVFSQQNLPEKQEVKAKFVGYKDSPGATYVLHNQSYEENNLKDIRFYGVRWGSLHSYQLMLEGIGTNNNSYLNELDINLEYRHVHRRRMECISDFFYVDKNSNISLCDHHSSDSGRYVEVFENPTSFAVINHNLGGQVFVTVIDNQGFVIEASIQFVSNNAFQIWVSPAIEFTVLVSRFESTFEHIQAAPVQSVVINHNLGKYPAVLVIDSQNYLIWPTVNYTNLNEVTIIFDEPISFKAYFG